MLGETCSLCSVTNKISKLKLSLYIYNSIYLQSPLMRSRDGTVTMCVICEPKATPVSAPQPIKPRHFAAPPVSSSATHGPLPLTCTPEQFYSTTAAVILESLDAALQVEPTFEISNLFDSTIQSALPALEQCSPIPPSESYVNVVNKVRGQILGLLDTSCVNLLSKRLELVNQLLILLKELENLSN